MKKPLWEVSTGSLVTWLLNNTKCRPTDLWEITLKDETVLRYSGGDSVVTVMSNTFTLGPHFQRSAVSQKMGVAVDVMDVEITSDARYTLNGVPFLQAAAKGALLGAKVNLMRVFVDTAGVAQGVVGIFQGRVGDLKNATRYSCSIQVRSFLDSLNVAVPLDVYQAACRNRLFDARCKLSESAWSVIGTLSTDMDATKREAQSSSAAVIAKPNAWASLGQLEFTSGPNAGQSRTVRTHVLSSGIAILTAMWPFPFRGLAGHGFILRAGCDKTTATCSVKFNNKPNYRGEPYIPPPETAL